MVGLRGSDLTLLLYCIPMRPGYQGVDLRFYPLASMDDVTRIDRVLDYVPDDSRGDRLSPVLAS